MARYFIVTLTLAVNTVTDVYLLNGAQEVVLEDATTSCLEAFNTSLACASSVQLLSYGLDYLSWSESNLTELCTSPCYLSLLKLESAVSTGCGTYSFDFNGGDLTAVQIVDLFTFKYNISCLADASTNDFCLVVEESWNITALNETGATWPLYTNKTYPNWQYNDNGSPLLDEDRNNVVNPFNPVPSFQWPNLTGPSWSGKDFYVTVDDAEFSSWGTSEMFEWDEYPLEIQCSSCFLSLFRLGIESQWGEVYE
jgi:hypothetical protein